MRNLTSIAALALALALAATAPLASAATFERVARTGDFIDAGGESVLLQGFSSASIGPGGQVVFSGSGEAIDGVFRYQAGTISNLYLEGESAPGVPDFSFTIDDLSTSFGSDGTLHLTAGIFEPSINAADVAVYRVESASLELQLDSYYGTFPDGTDIQLLRDVAFANGQTFTTVTHFESINNGTIDRSDVLLLGGAGPQTVLSSLDDSVPGRPDWDLTGFGGPIGSGNFLVVGTRIDNNLVSEQPTAFLRYDVATDGTLSNATLLAHSVDSSDLALGSARLLDLNEDGLTLFRGNGSLVIADGATLTAAVEAGDSLSDKTTLTIDSVGFSASIDGDQVLFSATLNDKRQGLYLWEAGVISTLIDTTQTLDGKTLTGLLLQSNQALADGQFTFTARFNDGTSGLYLGTIPEPASGLLLVGGLALVCKRRTAGHSFRSGRV